MNPTETTVVTSMAVTGLSVTLAQLTDGNLPAFRPIVGVGLAGFVLLLGANSGQYSKLSGQFAVLIATTAVLTTGYKGVAAIGRYLGST